MAITHKYTILCDEVRKEDNGKILIIGMYMGIITVPQLPFVLPSLTFFMIMDSDRPGHWGMKLKLQHLETGRILAEARGGIVCSAPGPALLPVKFGAVQLQAVGPYNFSVEVEEHHEPIITDFSVSLVVPPQMGQPGPMR
jgi:hypothetical protein